MYPCPGNMVAIGYAVVHYFCRAHSFSAGIKWRHCTQTSVFNEIILYILYLFKLISWPYFQISIYYVTFQINVFYSDGCLSVLYSQ